MGDVMHDDGFGGGVPQQRVQSGGYPPPAPGPASHVAMAGPRNQGLKRSLISTEQCCHCLLYISLGLITAEIKYVKIESMFTKTL